MRSHARTDLEESLFDAAVRDEPSIAHVLDQGGIAVARTAMPP